MRILLHTSTLYNVTSAQMGGHDRGGNRPKPEVRIAPKQPFSEHISPRHSLKSAVRATTVPCLLAASVRTAEHSSATQARSQRLLLRFHPNQASPSASIAMPAGESVGTAVGAAALATLIATATCPGSTMRPFT